MNDRHIPPPPAAREQVDLALPQGARLGPFEVKRLIARGISSFVYLATDHALALPVAIQEYLPMRLVRRDPWLQLHASETWHEDVLSRGMKIFIEESRLLARCEHPALVRVNHLFEANGTAYRVMPFHPGQRLSDVRREMPAPPDEASLRALVEPLLGALEAIHRIDQVHGGVSAANILLIADDFPLLLGAGAAAREIRSDLVESLMATVESQPGALMAPPAPTGATADLCALAEVMRFCITGEASALPGDSRRESLAALSADRSEDTPWPDYGTEFLSTLDAATSPFPEDWPTSVAQFHLWLTHGTPRARAMAPRPAAAPNPDVVSLSSENTVDEAEPFFVPMIPQPSSTAQPPASTLDPLLSDEPPMRPSAAPRRRWRGLAPKLLFGGVLAGLAVAMIGWVSGAWTLMPAISLDPGAVPAIARVEATAPPAADVQAVAPAVTAATAPISPAPPLAPSAPPPTAPPLAAAAPSAEPEHALASDPPGAAPAPRRAPQPIQRSRVASAALTKMPADPRAACANRTEFALYRCMVQQCQATRWAMHPQCVKLRQDDRVD